MALTELQRRVGQITAARRRESGGSYLAGGASLNKALATERLSRDLDLFHDTRDAVSESAIQDRRALEDAGLSVTVQLERPGFVQALVSDANETVLVEWVHDSAYRFFPLQPDSDFGLTLHALDLATNKVLALVGRVEVRDWADILACHARLQPLGYLAWAASGKDAGLSPAFILEEAARTARYSAEELAELAYVGPAPDLTELSRQWRAALVEARRLVDMLPAEQVGRCVLDATGAPFRGSPEALERALSGGLIAFHAGQIRGALPVVRPYTGA